jgi:hypothetical protein
MKFFAAMVMALGVMSSAQAASVTYSFTGFFYDIRGDGAGFVSGTLFTVTYRHDDTSQVGSLIEENRKVYSGGQLDAAAGTGTFNGPSHSELQIFNDWTSAIGGYFQDDGFFVSAWDYEAGIPGSFLLQFDMWDFSGTTLSSLDVSTHSEFSALAMQGGRFWIRRFQEGVETGLAQGGFVGAEALPIPTTLALLGFGLVGIARQQSVRSINNGAAQ